ncbi:ATP-binding protein [Streptomyces roseicoloratus]|uniref:ATP-binding protein n=1 Tax=Streptomyces roseicoloratus TaxID=2508722 RepID=UPI0015E18BF7|nr:ATP-binding protein [Streptomyces roseicoloratus]
MDPINRGPEEYGHDTEGEDARPGLAAPAPVSTAPARVRTARLVSGGLLLTVNPLDGSEIEVCPPGEQPPAPRRRTAQERAETARAATPPVPPGPAAPALPLLERQEQRDTLVGHLTRGRSARITGPAGSGRTRLLDAVAAECADVAPDGVVRLSGHHRTPTDLLYELFHAVQHAPGFRPDREELLLEVRGIGAIVLVDDLEFGGASLDELLAATPDCAFLFAAAPDTPAASADAGLEELALTGLSRAAAVELLGHATGRALTDDEINWAGDLWFESEGLPLRFVQAGALLRQRDRLRVGPAEFDAFGALEEAFGPSGAPAPADPPPSADDPDVELRDIPLPSLGEGAAPAVLLASRLSRAAQDTLRFAVALGGEVPHQAHLPALVGDTHADAAVGELMACGLLSPVGTRYRLAAGVLTQLVAQRYETDAIARVHAVAQHYAWWAGHPSVSPERATAEADSLLAALAALVPGTTSEHKATAVLLARAAAPAFAAGLHWSAWERALRGGQEAARLTGEVAEEAWFHHELGVLALCRGSLQRARAELEASIALRGALADKRGTVAGRRALALVADLTGETAPAEPAPATPALPAAPAAPVSATAPTAALPPAPRPPALPRRDGPASSPRGIPTAGALPAKPAFPDLAPPTPARPMPPVASKASLDAFAAFPDEPATVVSGPHRPKDPGKNENQDQDREGERKGLRKGILDGARRNLAAVGAGALLVAVLGTVVTLGATSGDGEDPGGTGRVTSDTTASQDDTLDDGEDGETEPTDDATGGPTGPASPTATGTPTPGATNTTGSPSPSGSPSATGSTSPSPSATTKPPKPTTSPTRTSPAPTGTTPPPTESTPPPTETGTPTPTGTATGESPSNSASASRSETAGSETAGSETAGSETAGSASGSPAA